MKTKKGDFIKINYVGRIKQNNEIFDLTDEKIAKENDLYNPKTVYGPIIICLGEYEILKGLDDELIGKEPGKYNVSLSPEKAFGKKNPELMKTVNTNIFIKQKINPVPGLRMDMGGMMGTIRSVTGGRTIIDFNHPLAGKDVEYEIEIKKIVENDEEKLKGFCKLHLNAEASIKEGTATLKANIPKEVHKGITEKIQKIIPNIKKVEYSKT